MASEESAKDAIAKEILRYFLRNQGAVDSLTEIARWRLAQERVRQCVEDTQAALDWLIAEGYVHEETRVGTESLFHLNPDRRRDAAAFVEDKSKNIRRRATDRA